MLYSGIVLMYSLRLAKLRLANATFVAVLAYVLSIIALRKQGPSWIISAG
jgi:hypothetical protein